MSTQTQQPVVVYPNTVSGQAPPSHSHSNGSFGTVFIVLAVIAVISGIACCLGRLCNRRMSRSKPSRNSNHNNFHPDKERDIEFGFDGKMPAGVAAKPAGYGDPSSGFKMPGNGDRFRINPEHVEGRGIRMPGNGDPAGIRFPGNGDPAGIRFPGNGDPAGLRIPGHVEFKGETKGVDDGGLKGGA